MAKDFEDGVEDVLQALSAGREVRGHGPYGVLIGDERLEFRPAVIADPVPTGRQVLQAAGVRDTLEHLLFLVSQGGLLQELGPGQTVDLRSAGIERFLVFRNDRSFRLELNDHVIEWGATRISGLTLKKLAGVDLATFAVWLDTRGGKDRQIGDAELFDLSAPGVERFYTALRTITVKVNTRPHQVHTETLTFDQVVKLAFADAATSDTRVYTVTFKRGPASNPEGTLVEGGSATIKDGMLFNVTFTDKS
ncbi:multiubiquitin domain-containing protein [Variovorax atrisoli]|uniref:multiubiquitin domain-containing protein n=1 Tax=Variovorax atrisoli TaxID=3394203 RepID=UPI000476F23B|nr:multiubiquitin domain-containing protein [Variovorax paradoxus]